MAIVVHTADRQSIAVADSGPTKSITAPTNIASGNLLRFIAMFNRAHTTASAGSVTLPSGFTQIVHAYRTDSAAGSEVIVGYKIAGGSEPGTYSFDAGQVQSGWRYAAVIDRISGHDPTTPVAASTSQDNYTLSATTATAPSITVDTAGSLLTAVYSNSSAASPTLTADSPLVTAINFEGTAFRSNVAEDDEVAAGASGTRSWTLSVEGRGAAAMFAINPAATSRNVPDVSPLYYGSNPLTSKTGINFKVTAGHTNLNGTVLASGTNGTTDGSGNFVLPAGVTMNDEGTPTAVDDPITLHLYWEEGSNPAVDRSLIVRTTAVAEA